MEPERCCHCCFQKGLCRDRSQGTMANSMDSLNDDTFGGDDALNDDTFGDDDTFGMPVGAGGTCRTYMNPPLSGHTECALWLVPELCLPEVVRTARAAISIPRDARGGSCWESNACHAAPH